MLTDALTANENGLRVPVKGGGQGWEGKAVQREAKRVCPKRTRERERERERSVQREHVPTATDSQSRVNESEREREEKREIEERGRQ